jgi:ParB-like chromosome segregation protein Spo0J
MSIKTAEAIAETTGQPFQVHETVMMAVQELNPAPYNPRSISPRKFDALKENIREFGFVENLTIQRLSSKYGGMIIVGGHQRIKAGREICIESNVPLPKLPCVVLELTDRRAKMLNVALNNIEGEFIAKLLGELLEDVNHTSVVLPEEKVLMGFEDEDFSKYMKFSEPPRVDPDPEPIVGTATLRLEFRSKKSRDAVKEKLEERAKVSRKQTGDVVLEMLDGGKRKR